MDVDFANAIGRIMGLEVEVTAGPFDAQIPGLESDRYDIAMGEYYITAERLEAVDFVSEWRDFSSFATQADDDFKPETGEDLCGRRVGVMSGSAEEASVGRLNDACEDPIDVNSFPNQAASFQALNSGRIDAVFTGRGLLQVASEGSENFKISGEYGGGPTATAVARTEYSAEMLEAVRAAFQELMDSGVYAEILNTWDTSYGAVEEAKVYTEDSTPPEYL